VSEFYNIFIEGQQPLEVPCPSDDKLPQPDDIYVFTSSFSISVADVSYDVGDKLLLMKRTDEAPRGRRSSLGNWVAISKNGVSVWSNIEWLIAIEHLKKEEE
jgi:hypothetical protein